MLQLNGNPEPPRFSLPGLFPVKLEDGRSRIFIDFHAHIDMLAEKAFSLAKGLDGFGAWSKLASSYVDHYLRLASIIGSWNLEDGKPFVEVNNCLDRFQSEIMSQISWSTFLLAHSLHPSSSSSPSPSTPSTNLPEAKRPTLATPKLVTQLPAHHPQPTQAAASSPKLPQYHSQATQTAFPSPMEVPAQHQKQSHVEVYESRYLIILLYLIYIPYLHLQLPNHYK